MQRVKCFLLRHQREGLVTELIYTSPPDETEIARVVADLEERHGATHPKTGEEYWTRVQPSTLLVPEGIAGHFEPADPEPVKARRARTGGAPGELHVGLEGPKVSGVGTVTNADGSTPEQ